MDAFSGTPCLWLPVGFSHGGSAPAGCQRNRGRWGDLFPCSIPAGSQFGCDCHPYSHSSCQVAPSVVLALVALQEPVSPFIPTDRRG